jgi:molecular chaperone GrpE
MSEKPRPADATEEQSATAREGEARASAGGDAASLEQLLAEAQAKIDEQREAWLRALADADNARKRAQAEIAAAHKFGVERLVEGLLPVADSLEAALGSPGTSPEALREGVELTLKQLRAAFERASVSELNPAAGERFDPHRHQAVSAVETEAEPNTIVAVMQKGYALHDRVVRPALVTVAKAKPVSAASEPAAT